MFSILYVDDEPGLLEIGKMFLEQGGRFSVETITSAAEALEILRTGHYDAIISDYQMPVMDGIEFLKHVRASGNTVPFIIFTGRGREEIVIQAFNEGADFYLQKGGEPVSQFAELGHKVQMAILQRRAEASVRDHERREADIINFLPDATFAIDTAGVVIAWNRAMERMTGVGSDKVLGKGDYEYALPFYHERRPLLINLVLDNNPAIAEKYPFVKREGKTLFSEITIPHFNDGRGAALWFTASPLYDTGGAIIGAIESIREITEWKRTEEALNESERRFRELADMLPQAVYEADAQGMLTYANRIAFEILGYTEEILEKGQSAITMIAPDDRARAAAALHQLVHDGSRGPVSNEYRALRKDGSTFPVSVYSSAVLHDGKTIGTRGIVVDITERKRAEESLRESEGRFSAFMDHLPVTAFIKDEQFTNLFVNRRMEELFGAGEWIGRSVNELFPPEAAEKMIEDDRQALRDGYRKTIEHLTEKNGDKKIFETHKFRIDRENKPPLLGGFAIDITEREQAGAALIESEHKYRTVFETTGTATVLIENDGTISLANSEFEQLSGYHRDEIENRKKWTEFVVEQDLDHMLMQHTLRRQDKKSALTHYEFRFRTRSGETRDIYLTIDVIPGTTKSVASLLDITERKQAEDNLLTASHEYANLLDQIQDSYYRSDAEGRLVRASRSLATLLGYDDLSECIGRSIANDFYVNPADRKQFLEDISRDGKVTDYEVFLRRKDGTPVLVSTSSHVNVDATGKFVGVEGTFRDITERKKQEHILRTQRDLGIALQTAHGMHETLDICLNAAIEISGLDSGGIYLVDEASGALNLVISKNLGDDFVNMVSHYPAGSANVQMVIAAKPIYTQYNRSGLIHTAVQEREGLRASAIIPIAFKNRVIACLNIASHMLDEIPVSARIALETIATQIGTAVEQIRGVDALAESEQRYRNIIEDQTEFICRFRPDGTHVFVNEAYCRYFGINREDIIGHRFRPQIPAEDRKHVRTFFASLTPDHPVDIIIHRILMPDGSVRWQRWSDRAIFDPSGNVIEYQSVGRDVTEMKETELALMESEERYRSLSEASQDLIFVIDKNDRVTYVNHCAAAMFGLPVSSIIGRERETLFPPDVAEGQEKAIRNVLTTGEGFRSTGKLTFNGQELWFDHSLMPIREASGTITQVLGISRDITEQKNIIDALRQKTYDLDAQNRLISTLLDTVPIGIFMVEAPSGKPIIANREASRLLGRGILPDTTGKNLSEVYEAYKAASCRKYSAEEMPIVRGMHGESHHIDDMVVVRPDGTKVRLEVFGTPVTDNQGRVIASLASFLDITERKRAEQVIREANRKINLLTSITRHDVGNQVIVLRGFTKIAQMKKPDPEVAGMLDKIDAAVSTIARQIEFTREYQELGMQDPGWQSIRDIVAQQQIPEGISLSCTCDAEVFADPMLERVFFNLIDNAVRHGETVTAIRVICQQDPDGLMIVVGDDGVGIPSSLKEKIFEKGFGKNTGFGLFLAREILAITGIIILETGSQGKGARFEIIVPKGMYRLVS
jgi:PAS domain S-box-containing protein